MTFKDRRTPGAYITEPSAFPPSVVGVGTAVPAFVGYTEKAEMSGKPVYLKPIRIGSLADYEQIFGFHYRPTYRITPATPSQKDNNTYDFKVLNPTVSPPVSEYYALTQTNASKFNLYNSMRLFYANGGGNCYVVSVGNYEQAADVAIAAEPDKTGLTDDASEDGIDAMLMLQPSPLNASPVTKKALLNGLQAIRGQSGPTMLVIPEAVLLPSIDEFADVAKAMLAQCAELRDRVALLDVYDTLKLKPCFAANPTMTLNGVTTDFRNAVGTENLTYGMAYFPFLDTTVVPATDFSYENLTPIDILASPMSPLALKTILTWENQNLHGGDRERQAAVQHYIDQMVGPGEMAPVVSPPLDTPEAINKNLTAALPPLADILRIIADKNDILPPSPAMAGIYTHADATRGVWNAPANISLSSVVKTTYKLDDDRQADLNMPTDGKAINAIREFVGRGNIVWGARTLDGNSNNYRYIQARRTLIYIEQSIKNALNGFVSAANDGNTWVTVTAMVSNFLQDLWSRGGLMGATASDAYDVQCGLGTTMTPADVLQGYMIVQVRVQMIRPAEFIELTFKQKMEGIS
jgi:uncharacterized protein